MIAEHLGSSNPYWTPDLSTLYSFVLVSRAWFGAGVPVLFRKLDLGRVYEKKPDALETLLENGLGSLSLVKELDASDVLGSSDLTLFGNLRKLTIEASDEEVFESLCRRLTTRGPSASSVFN
jgi:hypothetical protein